MSNKVASRDFSGRSTDAIVAWPKPSSASMATARQHGEPSAAYPTSSTTSPLPTKIEESSANQRDRASTPQPMVNCNEPPAATMGSSTIVAAIGTSISSDAPETSSTNRERLAAPFPDPCRNDEESSFKPAVPFGELDGWKGSFDIGTEFFDESTTVRTTIEWRMTTHGRWISLIRNPHQW